VTPARSPSPVVPTWRVRNGSLALDIPRIVAVLNVTPESFSAGGSSMAVGAQVEHVARMIREGADVIDIGGESTRPGARPVEVDEELARVLPAVIAVRAAFPGLLISIDTTKASVATAALEAGADIVNDVSGLRLDDAMAAVIASTGAGAILMHSRGGVAEMASDRWATYGEDVMDDVVRELGTSAARALAAGIAPDALVLDPGIGFAKRAAHSVAVLRVLPRLVRVGYPVLVGASRKRVVGMLTGVSEPAARDAGSIGVHVAALAAGARLFRVHAVAAHRQALDAAWAVLSPAPPEARG
jgi:dihydropteroate synthase